MKTISLIFVFFVILSFQWINAQDTIPKLRGNVNISIKKGTIECDLYLSNLPNVQNYVIRLNSGMNIRFLRDTKNKLSLYYDIDRKDSTSSGESLAYYLHENIGNHGRYLPKEIEFKYAGMYPVVTDSLSGYMSEDWRGNIAFNGYSVRAEAWQSAWYPVLFDMKKQRRYEKILYDVNITCTDCTMLYVNGSEPVKGSFGHFVGTIPHEMAIYCGNYEADKIGGTWLLNPQMDKAQQRAFANLTNSYQQYYEKNLQIPYKGSFTFVQTDVTAPDHAFSFVVSPTIFNVSSLGQYKLNSMFKKGGEDSKETVAHELAHYYYGTYLRQNTVFGHVIDEGFAEFLAFKITKNLIGDSAYQAKVKKKLQSLKYLGKHKPFSKIVTEDDFGNREYYLYYYTPILLTAIEKEIGEKLMWKWMQTMLNSKTDFTDYSFFEGTFDATINDKNLREDIKNKYFNANNALETATEQIKKN